LVRRIKLFDGLHLSSMEGKRMGRQIFLIYYRKVKINFEYMIFVVIFKHSKLYEMKKLLLLLAIMNVVSTTQAQIVESSCVAPEYITEHYRVDASVITLRKFYENNIPYKDSIEIPADHVDTVLNALLAVWNATSLPARDTVVDVLEINTWYDYAVRSFNIKTDTSLLWPQNIINGYEDTGNDTVDSILNTYNLALDDFIDMTSSIYLFFNSFENYNMPQLAKLFEPVYGVISVFAYCGGNFHVHENIEATIFADYVELRYSYGWGDCPNGCFYWRYWDFRVFNDCSVEYLGSSGDILPFSVLSEIDANENIIVYPNPVKDYLHISTSAKNSYSIKIINLEGQSLFYKTALKGNNEINLGYFDPGMYIISIRTKNRILTKRIIKL